MEQNQRSGGGAGGKKVRECECECVCACAYVQEFVILSAMYGKLGKDKYSVDVSSILQGDSFSLTRHTRLLTAQLA